MNETANQAFGSRQFLTAARVAWILDISERTLRDWTAKGFIACVRFGDQVVRYDPAELQGFIQSHTRKARKRDVAQDLPPEGWARLERLIDVVVASKLTAGNGEGVAPICSIAHTSTRHGPPGKESITGKTAEAGYHAPSPRV